MEFEKLGMQAEKLLDQFFESENIVLIKSKDRVKAKGEVFTPRNIVKDMLDLDGIKNASFNLDKTFLEPSCGNGNFVVQILARKLVAVSGETVEFDIGILRAVASIYGIEIMPDNVAECRNHMMKLIEIYCKNSNHELSDMMKKSISYIINRNIRYGDALKMARRPEENVISYQYASLSVNEEDKKLNDMRPCTAIDRDLHFSEWRFVDEYVIRREFNMKTDKLVCNYCPVHYENLISLGDVGIDNLKNAV